jgi:hypothetical protein
MQHNCIRKGRWRAHKDFAGVAVLERKARVSDQVREAISTAEDASSRVVGKALVGAVHGGLQGEGWGRALLVLHHSHTSQAGRVSAGTRVTKGGSSHT